MKKIIMIKDNVVKIGHDGNITEVKLENLSFKPEIGQEVEVFTSGEDIIVTLVKTKEDKINKNKVNKISYSLFAFFLGGFGAHKFYVGDTKSGVIRLIFFWTYIPTIIGIIDAIKAISIKEDDDGNILI